MRHIGNYIVMDLLSLIHDLGMEAIPLVQTFGHLEFALKLPEFRHLRELDAFPQEVCPSQPAAHALVREMVRQVMALHRTSRYLHIGCDEVFHLGACGRCTQRHVDNREIFAEYVTSVAEHIKSTYQGVTPLIWDDMMRQWSPQFLTSTKLGSLVEPVVWVYTDDIGKLVPHYVWHWYMKTFKFVWVAGAFKGATLSTSVLPDVRRHNSTNRRGWSYFENT
ncbi:hexosaminidase D-like [Nilaparvata lugens]|uniref:hexosaminidase D-like n=1 Tax=Nilaparvata lugens TaxID=108931 RepID=UPI00193DE190|nr:hexosaminidase D-like [Nilaparvata lugens]